MIGVVGAALLALLVGHAGLQLLPPTHLTGAGLGTVQLSAIIPIAHVKKQATEAANNFSELSSHGSQQQRAARNLLPDAATCEIAQVSLRSRTQ